MAIFRRVQSPIDLAVSMVGLKLGDRMLQLGIGNGRLLAALAPKVGITGQANAVEADRDAATRAEAVMVKAGALVDIHVGPYDRLPFEDGTFNVVVVQDLLAPMTPNVRVACLQEARRVLRPGGRCFVVETARRGGLAALFSRRNDDPHYASSGGALGALEAENFSPVRRLADRDGLTFTEGVVSRT